MFPSISSRCSFIPSNSSFNKTSNNNYISISPVLLHALCCSVLGNAAANYVLSIAIVCHIFRWSASIPAANCFLDYPNLGLLTSSRISSLGRCACFWTNKRPFSIALRKGTCPRDYLPRFVCKGQSQSSATLPSVVAQGIGSKHGGTAASTPGSQANPSQWTLKFTTFQFCGLSYVRTWAVPVHLFDRSCQVRRALSSVDLSIF